MNTQPPGVRELPELPGNVINVLRRIRRCESEAPAQLVLEHAMIEYARAALAQAAPGWMDIATAPRTPPDGAAVVVMLGFAPDEEGYSPSSREGFWSHLAGEWRIYGDPTWKNPPQPTHWRPLPPPPIAAKEAS